MSISLVLTAIGSASLILFLGPSEAVSRLEAPPPSEATTPLDVAPARFRMPSGKPTRLSCEAARSICAQTRELLAYEAKPIKNLEAFTASAVDWIDPHGLWGLSKDAPLSEHLRRSARTVLAEITAPKKAPGDCASAKEVGRTLGRWVDELRKRAEASSEKPFDHLDEALFPLASIEDARSVADTMGRSWATYDAVFGKDPTHHVTHARESFFPSFDDAAWSEIVLAGAVRAFVMHTDAHSAWAPLDEEASISEVDLVAEAPSQPWTRATMTALGPEVEGVSAPFEERDVLLSVGDLHASGLSLEQLTQLGYALAETDHEKPLMVIRHGQLKPLVFRPHAEVAAQSPAPEELPFIEIPYGRGHVAVIALNEVKDNLGDLMQNALRRMRSNEEPVGIVIDLRNNGGGSADGAQALVGTFLPRAPLFPTRRGDGSIEVEFAHDIEAQETWRGPVATLVDGDTASAAEMIAGALSAYGRGPSIGSTTFGKGCEQEYLDDDAHQGVLKLTTLLYALPDGTSVQRTGLTPTLALDWHVHPATGERESQYDSSAPAWTGADVRSAPIPRGPEWPPAAHVGPCVDEDVCRALTLVGSHAGKRSAARATKPSKPQKPR